MNKRKLYDRMRTGAGKRKLLTMVCCMYWQRNLYLYYSQFVLGNYILSLIFKFHSSKYCFIWQDLEFNWGTSGCIMSEFRVWFCENYWQNHNHCIEGFSRKDAKEFRGNHQPLLHFNLIIDNFLGFISSSSGKYNSQLGVRSSFWLEICFMLLVTGHRGD